MYGRVPGSGPEVRWYSHGILRSRDIILPVRVSTHGYDFHCAETRLSVAGYHIMDAVIIVGQF